MNAYLNLVKTLLASAVKNVFDWPRFLALEASTFLAQIHFLDFAVFWPLQLFYIGFFSL